MAARPSPTTASTFGTMLRRYRLDAGLTQEELAGRAGLSLRGVSDLERGTRQIPRLETVRMLAKGLGLSPDDPGWVALLAARNATDAIGIAPGPLRFQSHQRRSSGASATSPCFALCLTRRPFAW
jgi:transcriptional regulator with XRE-family HTH domain